MTITLSFERGVSASYYRAFVDSDDPPNVINFYGSTLALLIYCSGTRLEKSTADGSLRFRAPTPGWPSTRADDPRQGVVSCEFSRDETWALPITTAGEFELRRLIDGHVEVISSGRVVVIDQVQKNGIAA